MQRAQYDALKVAIEETRQARHDMRHHFAVLNALAEQKNWEELEKYLSSASQNIPDTELVLCKNHLLMRLSDIIIQNTRAMVFRLN